MTTDPTATFAEMTLRFITAEIGIGLTFAALAATEYAQGRVDRAREIRAKAEQACAEAERRFMQAKEHGWDVGELGARLRELRECLKDTEGEARNAA
jgi:hypothetical protein